MIYWHILFVSYIHSQNPLGSGVISHFNQEYVKTGVFEKEVSKIIRSAPELREQADYEDFYEATQEEAEEAFEQAVRFISSVEVYLREKQVM